MAVARAVIAVDPRCGRTGRASARLPRVLRQRAASSRFRPRPSMAWERMRWTSAAVARIFEAKGRPPTDPVIVHLASVEQLANRGARHSRHRARSRGGVLARGVDADSEQSRSGTGCRDRRVIDGRRQGAVASNRPCLTRGGIDSRGRAECQSFLTPESNPRGACAHGSDGRIDLLLDGGPSTIGVESTILDLSVTPPVVRRPGGVPVASDQSHRP